MRGVWIVAAMLVASEGTAHAIQSGVVDTTHSYAVAVRGNASSLCSGVLVTPNLVITARQCVQPFAGPIDCAMNPTFTAAQRTMDVATDSNLASPTWRTVKSVVLPGTNDLCGNDIALLVLTDLVAGVTPVEPAVNQAPNHPKYSFKLTAIGYGDTSPTAGSAGTRRIREQIPIVCVPGDASFPCPAGFDAGEFVGGAGMCTSDLGLAALDQTSFTNGAPVSLGVLSRLGSDQNNCTDSLFTRLDLHRDLIVGAAESASNNWALYPKPSWVDPPPPPDGGPGEKDAGEEAGGPTTTPTPGGGNTKPDGGATEEPAAEASDDGGGCRIAPENRPIGIPLLVGAVALALAKRRRNRR